MSEITLGELEASIKSLKLDAGLEAFNFVNTAGTFFTKVKQYFITAAPETKKALVKADFSPILKAYGHYNYTDFMERPVFQPARLAISYHEWLDVLNVLAAYCTYVETDLLPSTLTWMAELSVGKASVAYVRWLVPYKTRSPPKPLPWIVMRLITCQIRYLTRPGRWIFTASVSPC